MAAWKLWPLQRFFRWAALAPAGAARMYWDPSLAAYERKLVWLERTYDHLIAGRLCVLPHCLEPGAVAVLLHRRGRRTPFDVPFCRSHFRELRQELRERGRRQPDGTVLLDRRRLGRSRRLRRNEVLHGPATP